MADLSIIARIDRFYKQAQSSANLEQLLKDAILGSQDHWLLFLDLLEERQPIARKHLADRFSHSGLLGLFDALHEMFPKIIIDRDFRFNPKLLGKILLFSPTGYKDEYFNRIEYKNFECGEGNTFTFVNIKEHISLNNKEYDDLFILSNPKSGHIEEISTLFDGAIHNYNEEEALLLLDKYYAVALKDFIQIKNIFKA